MLCMMNGIVMMMGDDDFLVAGPRRGVFAVTDRQITIMIILAVSAFAYGGRRCRGMDAGRVFCL